MEAYNKKGAFMSRVFGFSTEEIDTATRKLQNLRDELKTLTTLDKTVSSVPTRKVGVTVDPEEQKLRLAKIKKDAETKMVLQKEGKAFIQSATKTQEEIADIEATALAQRLQNVGDFTAATEVLDARRTQKAAEQEAIRAANFTSTLNTISTLATNKNKELATIGKAAAIAQASIDTYAAANKALASAPPPWNFGLAALVVTAGLANVANMASYAVGGPIDRTGPALVHAGEFVLSANVVKAIKEGTPTSGLNNGGVSSGGGGTSVSYSPVIQINGGVNKENVREVCKQISDAARKGMTEALDLSRVVYKQGAKRSGETAL
jgi:translation initiation factor 2B subunit (eIF-2B alpha/beta/delta family)